MSFVAFAAQTKQEQMRTDETNSEKNRSIDETTRAISPKEANCLAVFANFRPIAQMESSAYSTRPCPQYSPHLISYPFDRRCIDPRPHPSSLRLSINCLDRQWGDATLATQLTTTYIWIGAFLHLL